MIKSPVRQQESGLRLISGWKYVSPSDSHLVGIGSTLRSPMFCAKLRVTVRTKIKEQLPQRISGQSELVCFADWSPVVPHSLPIRRR